MRPGIFMLLYQYRFCKLQKLITLTIDYARSYHKNDRMDLWTTCEPQMSQFCIGEAGSLMRNGGLKVVHCVEPGHLKHDPCKPVQYWRDIRWGSLLGHKCVCNFLINLLTMSTQLSVTIISNIIKNSSNINNNNNCNLIFYVIDIRFYVWVCLVCVSVWFFLVFTLLQYYFLLPSKGLWHATLKYLLAYAIYCDPIFIVSSINLILSHKSLNKTHRPPISKPMSIYQGQVI